MNVHKNARQTPRGRERLVRLVLSGQSGVEDLGTYMVRCLTFHQAHHDGTSRCVDNRMKFGVQPAFGAPDAAGNIPFLSRLEAARCALRCVASIINVSGGSPSVLK